MRVLVLLSHSCQFGDVSSTRKFEAWFLGERRQKQNSQSGQCSMLHAHALVYKYVLLGNVNANRRLGAPTPTRLSVVGKPDVQSCEVTRSQKGEGSTPRATFHVMPNIVSWKTKERGFAIPTTSRAAKIAPHKAKKKEKQGSDHFFRYAPNYRSMLDRRLGP